MRQIPHNGSVLATIAEGALPFLADDRDYLVGSLAKPADALAHLLSPVEFVACELRAVPALAVPAVSGAVLFRLSVAAVADAILCGHVFGFVE